MSSNLLAKCLPCIHSAIQYSLRLASAFGNVLAYRIRFHMSMVLREILKTQACRIVSLETINTNINNVKVAAVHLLLCGKLLVGGLLICVV